MKSFIGSLPLLFLLGGCSLFRGAQSTPASTEQRFQNIMIDSSLKRSGIGPCEPSICINPKNTKNIAAGAVLNNYYYSMDGGLTWTGSRLNSPSGVYGDPAIIADTAGNFYYSHLSDPEGRGWNSKRLLDRIVVQRSTDGGITYNDGAYMGLRHPKDQDKQWLGLDPASNTLYCTWTEFDLYNSTDTSNHSRILFSKSTDQGASWSDVLAISQFEGDCLDDDNTTEGAVPVAGPNGEIYVAWAWNNRIWFDRSLDGGRTWLQNDILIAQQPGGWTFDIPGLGRCNGMPVLVSDLSNGPNRGTLYVNWSDQSKGPNDTDIWLSKSTDGGNSWSKPVRVNNDKPGKHQFLSWLALDQTTGYLYIVFYDRRHYADMQTDVYLAKSHDGGNSWENTKISTSAFIPNSFTFFGDYNHISAHNRIIRPIWTRLDDGKLSVWTALIQD